MTTSSLLCFSFFFCSILFSSFALRVFVVDKDDNGKPSIYSVQLKDPSDSASEQKRSKLVSSSTCNEIGFGLAFNYENDKVFFQAQLALIPGDPYRTLKMSVEGKNLRSTNHLCEEDLGAIATAGNFTYTVDSNGTLWQGGLDDSTEMNPLFTLSTATPTFMKFENNSLYYTTGQALYEIPFETNSEGDKYLPIDSNPKLLFTPPELMYQFDFDPKKSGILYYATTKEIMMLNLTQQPPVATTFIKNLRAPVGVAVAEDPYYLLYSDTDALYQWDMDAKSSSELEVFTHTYGIAVSSAPSILRIFSSCALMFAFYLFLSLFLTEFCS